MNYYFKYLANNWQKILLITLIITAVVFSVTAVIPPKFKVSSKILFSCDAFGVSSACTPDALVYAADVMARSAESSSFIGSIKQPSSQESLFGSDDMIQVIKEFRSQVGFQRDKKIALVSVVVREKTRKQALVVNEAVNSALISSSAEYLGSNSSIKAELIDGPVSDPRPDSPNIWLNTLLGFVAGLLMSIAAVLASEARTFVPLGSKDRPIKWIGRQAKGKTPPAFDFDPEKDYFLKAKDPNRPAKQTKKTEKVMSLISQLKEKYSFKEVFKKEPTADKPAKTEESVKVVETSDVQSRTPKLDQIVQNVKEKTVEFGHQKAAAPENLPIFEGELGSDWTLPVDNTKEPAQKNSNGFMDVSELEGKQENSVEEKEPTEEEIKQRLNKLLRGDI